MHSLFVLMLRATTVSFLIAACILNCGGTKPESGYTDAVPQELRKLIVKRYSEGLYAVGTASAPEEGTAVRIATAEARAEIARQFQSQLAVLQKSYEELINKQNASQYQETIETFTSLTLTGSTIAKSMIKRDRGHSFSAKVLVVVSAEQLKRLVDSHTQSYTAFKASKAYKELLERVRREQDKNEQ